MFNKSLHDQFKLWTLDGKKKGNCDLHLLCTKTSTGVTRGITLHAHPVPESGFGTSDNELLFQASIAYIQVLHTIVIIAEVFKIVCYYHANPFTLSLS